MLSEFTLSVQLQMTQTQSSRSVGFGWKTEEPLTVIIGLSHWKMLSVCKKESVWKIPAEMTFSDCNFLI